MKALVVIAAMLATAAGQAATPIDGRTAFRAHCGFCHLEGGTGTIMLGRRVPKGQALLEARPDLHADYVRAVARSGLNSMPALTRVEVDDATLAAIADYLAKGRK